MELDRATFRRLVQLHLALLPGFLIVGLAESGFDRWSAFSADFDQLVIDRFGAAPADTLDGAPLLIVIAALGAVLIWNLAATIGLLRFRRWARWGSWGSALALFAGWFAVNGNRPSYASAVSDLLAGIDGALFGAILLLAYGRGFGQEWFAAPTAIKED